MSAPTGLVLPPPNVIPAYLETISPAEHSISLATLTSPASRAHFVRMFTPVAFPLARIVIVNGATVAGNVDVGIYAYGTGVVSRLASSGEIAQSGTSADQAFTVTCTIPAGHFYAVITTSDATMTLARTAPNTVYTLSARRLFYIANAGALPATIDTTTPVAASVYPYLRLER